MSFLDGVRLSVSIFFVAFHIELAACLNHMLYIKLFRYKVHKSSLLWIPGRLHQIIGYQSKNDHHHIDQILHDRCAVFTPAKGGEDEEDGQPNDHLAAHEHAHRAEHQGDETGAVGLFGCD